MSAAGQVAITPDRIMQMAWGYAPPLILEAAIRHGIFDRLAKGALSEQEIARETGISPRGARAVLNTLVGLEFLTRDSAGRFGLTPESEAFLVSGKPGYMGGLIGHTSTHLIPHWLKLADVVKEGKPSTGGVNQESVGTEFFHKFVEDIFPMSYAPAKALAKALRVRESAGPVRVLDIAAGSGVWGIALAEESSNVAVTAVDWPGVLEVTRKMAARHGVEKQCTFVAGDLATADFGANYNIATLGHILHSEGEARSRELLRKVHAALASGGTIAIQEFLVNDDRSGPARGLIFAVNMLVATENGDTFSFEEIAGWLKEAGFSNPRLLEAPGPSPLILADR
jgi:ubiquinone/menaquinone biosynthesis C-methylase UbiE